MNASVERFLHGAIACGIYDAVGVWVDDLPITPERMLSLLLEKEMKATTPMPLAEEL